MNFEGTQSVYSRATGRPASAALASCGAFLLDIPGQSPQRKARLPLYSHQSLVWAPSLHTSLKKKLSLVTWRRPKCVKGSQED